MARQAQLFSFDFSSSLVAFMVFFLIFLFSYAKIGEEKRHAEELRVLISSATALSDVLVTTQGYPQNWTNESVVTIGLSEKEENVISIGKLTELGNISYLASKDFLPIRSGEYFLNISLISGEEIFSYGLYPENATGSVVPIVRMVLFNNGTDRLLAKVEVIAWK